MVDFAALFRHSPNPYMVVDRDLRYLAVNEAYATILSTTADALVGRRVFDAFPGDVDDAGHPEADAVRRSILRVTTHPSARSKLTAAAHHIWISALHSTVERYCTRWAHRTRPSGSTLRGRAPRSAVLPGGSRLGLC